MPKTPKPSFSSFLPLFALLLLWAPLPAHADAEHNAALRYWRGMALMTPELEAAIKAVDFDLISDPDWAPDGEIRAHLESSEAQSVIHEFVKGAALPVCDFGIDRDEGIDTLLPHLGGLRRTAVLLTLDGRLKLAGGDAPAAATRFATVYALAAHSAEDRYIVSSLVAASIVGLCDSAIMHESILNQLGPNGRETVLLATWRFGADDPFLLKHAVEFEGEMLEAWIRRFAGRPVSETQLRAAFESWGIQDDSKELLEVLNDPALLDADLVRMRLLFTEVTSVWSQPDAIERIGAIEKNIGMPNRVHPYGLLTEIFAPSVRICKKNELKGIAMLDRARTLLAQ